MRKEDINDILQKSHHYQPYMVIVATHYETECYICLKHGQ